MTRRRRAPALTFGLALMATVAPAAPAQSCTRDTVTAPELADAMQTALRSSRIPYDIRTTTNSTRFETHTSGYWCSAHARGTPMAACS